MKFNKGILQTILIQLLLVYNPLPLVAQELDEVIKRYTKSKYGNTELDSVRSLRMFGFIKNNYGQPDYYFVKEIMIPNLIKIEYFTDRKNKGYTIAYDGDIGWELNANHKYASATKLSQEELTVLLEKSIIILPFIQPEKSGTTVELFGNKKLFDDDNFQIGVKFKNGKTKRFFIDSNDYKLNHGGDTALQNSEIRYSSFTSYKDYRKVNGIFFSFLEEQIIKTKGKKTNIRTLRIEVNPEFKDSHFKMPQN